MPAIVPAVLISIVAALFRSTIHLLHYYLVGERPLIVQDPANHNSGTNNSHYWYLISMKRVRSGHIHTISWSASGAWLFGWCSFPQALLFLTAVDCWCEQFGEATAKQVSSSTDKFLRCEDGEELLLRKDTLQTWHAIHEYPNTFSFSFSTFPYFLLMFYTSPLNHIY